MIENCSEHPFLYLDLHTHIPSYKEGVTEILNLEPEQPFAQDFRFFSMGIHPWKSEVCSERDMSILESCLAGKDVIAVGEVGLDLFRKDVDIDKQEVTFRKQIDLAYAYQRPLILHAVKAVSDIIRIRKDYPNDVPWIIHGYRGNEHMTKELLKHDFYFSFGDAITQPTNKLLKSIECCPLSQLFLETDNTTTNKIDIHKIYHQMARLKDIPIHKLKENIFTKFIGLFEL